MLDCFFMIVVYRIFHGSLSLGCTSCSVMVYCSTSVVCSALDKEVYPVGYHVYFRGDSCGRFEVIR